MKAIGAVLLGMMWLSPLVSAADDEAPAITGLPYEFIPAEYLGKWVLTRYQYFANTPTPPMDPDYFVGRQVEIGNNWVNLFGHVCEVSFFRLRILKGDPQFYDFDKSQIPDADINEKYPFSRLLEITCWPTPESQPQGPEAAFLGFKQIILEVSFQQYDPSGGFLTLGMSNGPTFILLPVDQPHSQAPHGEPAD